MQVVIPACGSGTRFAEAGYKSFKPFIPVAGKPMVQHVIDALPLNADVTILLPQGEHADAAKFLLRNVRVHAVPAAQHKLGAVQTLLASSTFLRLARSCLVINCDNVIRPRLGWDALLNNWRKKRARGGIATFVECRGGPFSYVYDPRHRGVALQVYEKQVCGPYACAGAFWFHAANTMLDALQRHLNDPPDVGNEWYVAPTFNRIIEDGGLVVHTLMHKGDTFIRMGVPEDIPAAQKELLEWDNTMPRMTLPQPRWQTR